MKAFFRPAVAACGFASMLAQLTLMREFLGVFYGNELVVGVVLGGWMLLTGLGGLRTVGSADLVVRPRLSVRLLPARSYCLRLSLPQGLSEPSWRALARWRLGDRSIFVFRGHERILPALRLPVVMACDILSEDEGAAGVGDAYMLDTVGCVFGALAFSFVFASFLDPTQVSYAASLVLFGVAIRLACGLGRQLLACAPGLAMVLAAFSYPVLNLQDSGNAMVYPRQEVLWQKSTRTATWLSQEPAARSISSKTGCFCFRRQDIARREEWVHYAMPQVEKPDSVLLISGGASERWMRY